jgi:hypothetical protein
VWTRKGLVGSNPTPSVAAPNEGIPALSVPSLQTAQEPHSFLNAAVFGQTRWSRQGSVTALTTDYPASARLNAKLDSLR